MDTPSQQSQDELNQLFIAACEDHQNGLLDSARSLYLQLIESFPEAPILNYNLGLVYFDQGEYEKARESFSKAAELNPDDTDIWYNLALSQKNCGQVVEAIETYEKVLQVDPGSIDTLYNLAGCFKDSGQISTAIKTYHKVLELAPDHLSANSNLAYMYHRTENNDQASYYYKKVLEYDPQHEGAAHMLASLTGIDKSSSSQTYVREIFDDYSDHYEHSLVTELEYCVPSSLREALEQNSQWLKKYQCGLDLGCGTGLSAQYFVDIVTELDGIDLSEKMIELAEKKNIYRHLHTGSITELLMSTEQRYDFYIAADVFAYVGDLTEMFSLLEKRAYPEVLFCFSTENFKGSGYQLQKTGRFAHSSSYIEDVAEASGWRVEARYSTSLRKEKGIWVQGDLWFLSLPDGQHLRE